MSFFLHWKRQKLTAPCGFPGRSPTPVLTGPWLLNFGGRRRAGAFDTAWPSAKEHKYMASYFPDLRATISFEP